MKLNIIIPHFNGSDQSRCSISGFLRPMKSLTQRKFLVHQLRHYNRNNILLNLCYITEVYFYVAALLTP